MRDLEPIGDYRGAMLLAEIEKQMPLAGTQAAIEAEEAVSAMEEAAGITDEALPAEGEPVAPEGEGQAPAALEEQPAEVDEVKAMDRARWERKALKALREKGRAAVAFTPDALTPDEAERIRAALEGAQSVEAVKAAFKAEEGDVWSEAERWARLALEGA